MKKSISLCIVLILSTMAFAEKPDFRNVLWGMNPEQVVKNETLSPIQHKDDTMVYQTEVNNLECFLAYRFIENKLYSGTYVFQEKYTNYNGYISDYNNLKELLEKKYGEVADDDVRITNEMARGIDPGVALSMGYLGFASQWETNATDICLMLYGDDFECTLVLLYESKEYAPLAEQANEEKTMDSL